MKKLIRKKIKIGYKKASGEYIVKLQILGKNNEKRENVSIQFMLNTDVLRLKF